MTAMMTPEHPLVQPWRVISFLKEANIVVSERQSAIQAAK
jgi:hypothetical protein